MTAVQLPQPRPFPSPITRLRIGSELITSKSGVFRVREAFVLVAENGGESHSMVVGRVRDDQVAKLLITVGMFANMIRGATHRREQGCSLTGRRFPAVDIADVRPGT
jgi:hypothetical protein